MLCPKNSDLMSLMILVGFSCDLTHWLICIGWRSWSRTSSWTDSIFLPHDAMHKHGLCRRTVSVCPSAYLSVRPSRSCILLKRVNIFSKFFTVGYPQYSIYFLYTKCYGSIPTAIWNLGKIAIFDQYLTFESMTGVVSNTVNNLDCVVKLQHQASAYVNRGRRSRLNASVNLVYDSKPRRRFLPCDAMHKRGLCCVMRCPSVCPSVRLLRSWILSKKVILSSKFSPSVATQF